MCNKHHQLSPATLYISWYLTGASFFFFPFCGFTGRALHGRKILYQTIKFSDIFSELILLSEVEIKFQWQLLAAGLLRWRGLIWKKNCFGPEQELRLHLLLSCLTSSEELVKSVCVTPSKTSLSGPLDPQVAIFMAIDFIRNIFEGKYIWRAIMPLGLNRGSLDKSS
jgi:hypothetical protein